MRQRRGKSFNVIVFKGASLETVGCARCEVSNINNDKCLKLIELYEYEVIKKKMFSLRGSFRRKKCGSTEILPRTEAYLPRLKCRLLKWRCTNMSQPKARTGRDNSSRGCATRAPAYHSEVCFTLARI